MANTVTFYQTPFDSQNRPQSIYDYTAYFNSNTGTNVNVNYVVMPNVPFVVPVTAINANNILKYNYIKFTYNSMTVYAFIDRVEYFANENAYYVYHNRDNWFEYLNNYTSYGPIQGVMNRGHINDINSSGNISLTHTLAIPEETIITSDITNARFIPYKGTSDISCLWLYIYVANPFTIVKSGWEDGQSFVNKYGSVIPNVGFTFVYPLIIDSTNTGVREYVISKHLSAYGYTDIRDLTNQNITSMLISTIPPDNDLVEESITIGSNTHSYYSSSNLTWIAYNSDDVEGMPTYGNTVYYVEAVDFTTSEFVSRIDDTTITFEWYRELYNICKPNAEHATSFSNYVNYMPKLCSSVYNPMYLDNLFIQQDYLPTSDSTALVSISLSPDLSQYIYLYSGNTTAGVMRLASVHYKQTTTTFSPTVLLDYWTRLNASIESMNAQKQQVTTVLNAVGSVATGVSRSALGIASGNPVLGASAVASAGLNIASNTVSAYYDYQVASANKEIADYQYQTGYTNETGALYLSGIASFTDVPSINIMYIGVRGDIGLELHKHGYNANLNFNLLFGTTSGNLIINDTYRRKVFNFVQAESVNILGVNRSMRDDIREMFKYGVTLWSFTQDSAPSTADSTKIANAGDIYQINYGIITGW